MNAGKLNKRITVYAPGTLTDTTIGGQTEGAKTSTVCWCAAKQLSAFESSRYGLTTNLSTYRFTFRYETAKLFDGSYSFVYNGRTFVDPIIEHPDENKTEINVIACERTN